MKKLLVCVLSGFLAGGMAMAQDTPSDDEKSPGARIAGYGKVGRVVVDGQSVYISKGLTDIIMEEGKADLENDNKIQCQRVKRTGSHIIMRICRTVAEIAEQEEFNREYWQRWYLRQAKHVCAEGGGNRAQRTSNPTFGVQGSAQVVPAFGC